MRVSTNIKDFEVEPKDRRYAIIKVLLLEKLVSEVVQLFKDISFSFEHLLFGIFSHNPILCTLFHDGYFKFFFYI